MGRLEFHEEKERSFNKYKPGILMTVGTDDSKSDNAGQMIPSTSCTSREASLFDEVAEEPANW
jgi:hypothetical protein